MNIEEQLKRYRENQNIIPDEQHIKETVRKSIESYCSVEQEKQLTYWEFLWTELHLIRKRWWLLQMLLLWTAATLLPYLLDNRYVIRMLGIETGNSSLPQLYNLHKDLGERKNVAEQYPDVVEELAARLLEIKDGRVALPLK